jgi:acetyl esterase/lipase
VSSVETPFAFQFSYYYTAPDGKRKLKVQIFGNPIVLQVIIAKPEAGPRSGIGVSSGMLTLREKSALAVSLFSIVATFALAADTRTPTLEGILYGTADGQPLTMDYYAPKGNGIHPIAIIIHGGGYHGGDSKSGSEAYVADFLAPAGYAVFSVNYRLAPKYPYPYMVLDVQRAVRYIRYNASQWNADPDKIALVGGSAGGFLSNMVGLLNAPGDPKAADPVDRVSAKAQAVVSLYAQSSFEFVPLNADVHRLLDPLIAQKGEKEAIREASPITYDTQKSAARRWRRPTR